MLTITTNSFENDVLRADKPVLVDFWAQWCPYCRRIAPAFDKVGEQYAEPYGEGRIVGVAFVSVSFASILIGLITQVLDAGYKCYCLGVHRREEMPYESLFDGFTFAGKVIALYIVEGFFVALWSMLFVIPGIIAVYRYSFAIWNLCQNPELGVMEALNRSKRQTIGYKGQLFGLHLSFIGWYLIVFVIVGVYEGVILALMPDSFLGIMLGALILTVLTGVVDIYLTPYFALSECGFYLRATAPEEPPRQDRSGYTPEF